MKPLAWKVLDGNTTYAHSEETRLQYLVVRDQDSGGLAVVRLCRVPESLPMHTPLMEARAALRTEVMLAAGRGPGRPSGGPELAQLVIRAQQYAERYDDGEDLEFAGWQHEHAGVSTPEDMGLL